ncbi:MAG TPA: TonB-dependent receptor [Candidatus Dormibacteraeota bacterium]|nr:TonB-dependent receptor [Candidatus Dormibacteraeota bacterium]
MKKFFCGICALVFCLSLTGRAWSQTQITTGTVQGDVIDEKGGTVAAATVEIRNLDTNFTRTETTEPDGHFAFLLLPPGRYTLTTSKEGFATIVQENIDLTVGQAVSLPVAMKVSSTSERIVVTATPAIESTETASSTTLNELSVSETPVLGRKFEDLLTLTPGVSIVQGPDGDEINFNGQRGIFNNISLDGGDYNNGFFGEQMGGQRAAIDITLDAVKEFQVVASGASAEFGRTAGGVVNVVTKSGTNDVHGSAFYYQRLKALASSTSDGQPLDGFHREQFGGTVGGPIKKDKMFFFGSGEGITANLRRKNLSTPLGAACAVANPVVGVNDALINGSAECQRVALVNFYKTNFKQDEGQPLLHPVRNAALLGKYDWDVTPKHRFSASYNYDYSKNTNQTFDVPTYGTSANGIEGPSKIQAFNTNFFSTISNSKLNELHFTYGRENRPRNAVPSNVPDTAMGFGTSFRFGQPFFLEPAIDEVFWRTDLRDSFSIISGKHNWKFGGEWLHSVNSQIFRGFFTGRYIFDGVTGFLRYASPKALGPGFGPSTAECADGTWTDLALLKPNADPKKNPTCPSGALFTGGPLLFYLEHGPTSSSQTLDSSGASSIANNEYALFIQDKWQVTRNLTLNYGLRWEAQIFPDPVLAPSKAAYGTNLTDPRFPSNGTLPNQKKMFQPRVGFSWDVRGNSKSVLRASYGIYNARQNMLTQVGAITTNGVQQQSIFASSCVNPPACNFFNTATGGPPPTYPTTVPVPLLPPGTFPFQPGVTVFSKDYANPRIYTTNVAFQQELLPSLSAYADFTLSKGVHLTRFVNPNVSPSVHLPATGDTASYGGQPGDAPKPFGNLGDITNTVSNAKSLYRGVTFGVRKRFSSRFQMEGNYTYSVDRDDDSNERDPFSFRYANFFNLASEYAYSDRDERHRFNFYTYGDLPWGINASARMQAHSAQPITPQPRFLAGVDRGRNTLRKDNAYFSFDWRLERPIKFGDRMKLIPTVEMFNTFNNKNNVNPLSTPVLFNFDGFLRQGVGDPRQAQLALRFVF